MDPSVALGALCDGLRDTSYNVTQDTFRGREALIARCSEFRWQWMASRLHVYVIAFAADTFDPKEAERLTTDAQQYAIAHKPGLPRGLQNATATIATFLTAYASEGLKAAFRRQPTQRFAALRLPVLVDLTERRLVWFEGHLSSGELFHEYLNGVIRTRIAPTVGCAA